MKCELFQLFSPTVMIFQLKGQMSLKKKKNTCKRMKYKIRRTGVSKQISAPFKLQLPKFFGENHECLKWYHSMLNVYAEKASVPLVHTVLYATWLKLPEFSDKDDFPLPATNILFFKTGGTRD